jgi:hypothetical protein
MDLAVFILCALQTTLPNRTNDFHSTRSCDIAVASTQNNHRNDYIEAASKQGDLLLPLVYTFSNNFKGGFKSFPILSFHITLTLHKTRCMFS